MGAAFFLRITGLSTIEVAEWMRIQPLAELRMKIPSLQDMIDLYGYSMELTLEARCFQIQVEHLKRLALNSEILAVRTV